MRITPVAFVKEMHGKIPGMHSVWHARTNRNGTIYLARNSHSQKPPTAGQLAQREKMRNAAKAYEKIAENPELKAIWTQKLAEQTRYRNLRSLVIGTMVSGNPNSINLNPSEPQETKERGNVCN